MQTEKEKAAAGLIYDANNDPELQQEMLQTRQKLHTISWAPSRQQKETSLSAPFYIWEKTAVSSPHFIAITDTISI